MEISAAGFLMRRTAWLRSSVFRDFPYRPTSFPTSFWEAPLVIRSDALRCCDSSCFRSALRLLAMVVLSGTLAAQLTTGVIEGTLRGADGRPTAEARILVTGAAGFRMMAACDANGEFAITLPYGHYQLFGEVRLDSASSGAAVLVAPLQTTRVDLIVDETGNTHEVQTASTRTPGIWTATAAERSYPVSGLAGLLLSGEPSSITAPLDLT